VVASNHVCQWFVRMSVVTVMHVVWKFRQIFIESEGECFGFVEFGMYLLKCSFLLS